MTTDQDQPSRPWFSSKSMHAGDDLAHSTAVLPRVLSQFPLLASTAAASNNMTLPFLSDMTAVSAGNCRLALSTERISRAF